MTTFVPEKMLLLAGGGDYPLQLARGMRRAGVKFISVQGCYGATDRSIRRLCDEYVSFRLGEFEKSIRWLQSTGIKHVIMAGQLNPIALFTAHFDSLSRGILASLPVKNAHTIYGAWIHEIEKAGLEVLPASCFMDEHIPGAGVLTRRAPEAREMDDIGFGHRAGLAVCDLDIGQTILVKEGMVLAVEAFEGTNHAIKRGAKLGGRGAVMVKVAKNGHDMRFDIPVVGRTTIKMLHRYGVTALAYQANRLVMLQQDDVIRDADRFGIAIVGLETGLEPAPLRPTVGA